MCTVTFVLRHGTAVITSNRDEQPRRRAFAIRTEERNGKTIRFPQDPQAGGTWFAVDDEGNAAVLLNGAAEKHRHAPPYRRSRGLILLDFFATENALASWDGIDLTDVESFTVVLYLSSLLYQLRWDGNGKETLGLSVTDDHIWSSSTLYPLEVRRQREKWFREFLQDQPTPTPHDLFEFHRHSHEDDRHDGLVIERGSHLQTVSITQTVLEGRAVQLTHHDLATEPVIQPVPAAK
ncbi:MULTISPECIES: NRDE family protein [unclassified Flavobacterium]|uniref:NRDE family protein n=1 Tax=unclassified Flavobacterium TaxID=196869 RepID=UPI001F12F56A|nr:MULTISPECIES: NRDE family protein [unclassified Flavobacterium]UMY67023.1 NRDE family protein [Flavobacterium sp. HJ-32-4]